MNRKEKIEMEMRELINELEPIETTKPIKRKKSFVKIIMLTILGLMVLSPTLTYEPAPFDLSKADKITYYPIDPSQVEITIKAVSVDDSFPVIRIGPGCSARPRTRPMNNNPPQRV